MSRIGKKPVGIPAGVTVTAEGNRIGVKGPKGELSFPLYPEVVVKVNDGKAVVETTGVGGRNASAIHGLTRACLANMVHGVVSGFERKLDIIGVGWNVKLEGNTVALQVGFSHPVKLPVPQGLQVECPTNTSIVVRGIDKQQVGQFAATIRMVRPPEPYKGKGIKYVDEVVRRKAGKAFGS